MSANSVVDGTVTWQSPSNIALVKYWGKHGRQLPSNPSISFTLCKAYTETEINFNFKEGRSENKYQFLFEGKENKTFGAKVKKFISSISDELPFLKNTDLIINSQNSFPHSSGIASSASSMSALVLCLLDIRNKITGTETIDLEKASHLSRLGSGSASRSVYGPLAIWGSNDAIKRADDTYAIPFDECDEIFRTFHDDILIVSASEKAVSSRAGHALMENNPYALNRFEQAHKHLAEIILALKSGDLEKFGEITEKEAFTLHALMMASTPPYMLMEPNTIEVINQIQNFRKEKNVPVYFTLDAGPNVHMLYPDKYSSEIEKLKESLVSLCAHGRIIEDIVGSGPTRLK